MREWENERISESQNQCAVGYVSALLHQYSLILHSLILSHLTLNSNTSRIGVPIAWSSTKRTSTWVLDQPSV